MTSIDVKYDNLNKTITGLSVGSEVLVTIKIIKVGDVYTLISQKVELIKSTGPNQNIINNMLEHTQSQRVGGSLSTNSRDIYILPKINKRKVKTVYNKTLNRRARD